MLQNSNFRVSEKAMISFPANDYQQQLIVASLDDFTPNAALPNFMGGQFGPTPESWKQEVIAFLCANIECGLIEATHRPEIATDRDIHALRSLLTEGDVENDIPVDILWNALYFNGTDKLKVMLEAVNMRCWEAVTLGPNLHLIADLENLYKGCARN